MSYSNRHSHPPPSTAPSPALTRRHLITTTVAGAAAAMLAACGGGGDSGNVQVGGSVGSGGTGSFSSGAIRGFGSIVVNGVHYDETTAKVVGDAGASMNSADLRLGMMVEVTGSDIISNATTGRRSAKATSIQLRSEIEGPISAINAAAGTMTVLGQLVRITATTVFDDDLRNGLASLAVGQIAEVYGLMNAAGEYTATRVERESAASSYKLRGVISQLDTATRTLRIGNAVVFYGNTSVQASAFANGTYARITLQTQRASDGSWIASRITTQASGSTSAPASSNASAEIEGYITSYTSSARFSVNGIPVDASRVTRLPAGLATGVRVEVDGQFSNGTLIAREI